MVGKAKVEHKRKVHKPVDTPAPPPPADHNATAGQSREEFLFFTGQIRAWEKDNEALKKRRKALNNQIKLKGYDLGQMKEAMEEQDRDDGTTLRQMRVRKQYYEWLNLPIGSQMQLFATPGEAKTFSQEEILERAEREGLELGIQGFDADSQKYPGTTPEGQAHLKGWNAGQDVLKARLKDLKEVQAAEERKAAGKRAAKKSEDPEDNENAREEAAVH